MSKKALEAAAVDFLQTSFNEGEPEKAVREYVGDKYIQHNSQVGDGADAFVGFVQSFRGQFPEMHLEVKRTITQDDMVVTHSHLVPKPGGPGVAVADFFRFQGDKLVEHWDVIQNIPDDAANSNSMF